MRARWWLCVPWLAGCGGTVDTTELEDQIAFLESENRALEETLATVQARLYALETEESGSVDPELAARIDALEGSMEALLGAGTASELRASLDGLDTRVGTVETRVVALETAGAASAGLDARLGTVEMQVVALEVADTTLAGEIDALEAALGALDPQDQGVLLVDYGERLDELELRADDLELRADGLDTRADGLDTRADDLELRADGLDTRADGLDTRADDLELRADGLALRADGHDDLFDDSALDMGALTTRVNNLEGSALTSSDLSAYATTAWVQGQLSSVSGGSGGIPGLADYLTVDTTTHDIIFEGANLHVRSGAGSTDEGTYNAGLGDYLYGSLSGLGNVIIGYNSPVPGQTPVTTGSHNLVLGEGNSYSAFGSIVSGWGNTAVAANASLIGGGNNYAGAWYSVVVGGESNTTLGSQAAVCGGALATAHGANSVTVGGYSADALGGHDVAVGGYEAATWLGTNFDLVLGTRTGSTQAAWSN